MTKEELERIKTAYYSGLKVQIWFDGYWEDFDVRDYSMYKDPFSVNRQYRIVGSDYANKAEKRIADLEKENELLKGRQKGFEEQILGLLSKYYDFYDRFPDMQEAMKQAQNMLKENAELKEKLTAIRNAKDKYDMSKDKSIIKACGAEYYLFCDLERILEDWQEDNKLIKAKEIIKRQHKIIEDVCDISMLGDYAKETLKNAEQFLNSEVENE